MIGRGDPRTSWIRVRVKNYMMAYLATPVRALARAIRHEDCGAILCQEYECARFDVAVLVGKVLRIPVFSSFHAGDLRSALEKLLHPLTVRASAGVIISAEREAERARRVYGLRPT